MHENNVLPRKMCFFTQPLGRTYRTIIFEMNLYILENLKGQKIPVFGKKTGVKMTISSDNAPKTAFYHENVILFIVHSLVH